MTNYEKLTLKLKICELSMMQVGLELSHNGRLHIETEAILEVTQDNIMILCSDIEEACKNAQAK